jgi:hypothetical protein
MENNQCTRENGLAIKIIFYLYASRISSFSLELDLYGRDFNLMNIKDVIFIVEIYNRLDF